MNSNDNLIPLLIRTLRSPNKVKILKTIAKQDHNNYKRLSKELNMRTPNLRNYMYKLTTDKLVTPVNKKSKIKQYKLTPKGRKIVEIIQKLQQ